MLDLNSLFERTDAACGPAHGNHDDSAKSVAAQSIEPILQPVPAGQSGTAGTGRGPTFSEVRSQPEALCPNGSEGLGPLGPLGPRVLQGGERISAGGNRERGSGNTAPGWGAASNKFALHPSAVILALAYFDKEKLSIGDLVSLLAGLGNVPPNEQVRQWHEACMQVGLKPWELLFLPAPSSGLDCTMCKHLTTRQMWGDSGRREFHWACGLGYLILETGRGTERIWIAPPECQNYERWYPSDRR